MAVADTVRLRSPDAKTQVGAVLVGPNDRIISTGYNGPPAGYPDDLIDWSNRDFIHPRVVHAEMNAILYAGGRYEGATIYTTLSPCKECLKLIAAAGIKTIIYKDRYKDYAFTHSLSVEFGLEMRQFYGEYHGKEANDV